MKDKTFPAFPHWNPLPYSIAITQSNQFKFRSFIKFPLSVSTKRLCPSKKAPSTVALTSFLKRVNNV